MNGIDVRSFDVVVLGSGVSGSSAAAAAARAGAKVALLEKLDDLGGSAALSAGMFWTAPDLDSLRRRIPLGREDLAEALIADYEDALAEIRASGVRVADEPKRDIMTFGIGYSTDIHGILAWSRQAVLDAGGEVRTGVRVRELTSTDGVVDGVLADVDGGLVRYAAPAVVLATGGFQGDPEMLTRYMGPNADRMPLRSNPGSVGDGLRLARTAGAGGTKAMSTFYGHLVPWPLGSWASENFLPYSQYYSGETVLVNLSGDRFCDETQGDELLNQLLLFQPEARGVLVFDERVRSGIAVEEPFPGLGALDRVQIAIDAGGLYATAGSLEELVEKVAAWGVDPDRLRASLDAHRSAVERGASAAGGVAVAAHAQAPTEAPFHALMVQPTITFTFGGVPVTPAGEVCDPDSRAIPGLYAAGADIGGLSNFGYAGGLAPCYISGRWAGRSAAARALQDRKD